MSRRGYIDLTPKELLARRYIVWGLAFLFLPSLLTSCHFGDYLCRASWHGGVSLLVTLWSVFPWMIPVAIAALGGLGMIVLGGMLLLTADNVAAERVHAIAFQTCIGSLFATLLIGGFGYVVLDAAFPGFYRSEIAVERVLWLAAQMSLVALYLIGVLLTLSPVACSLHTVPVNR
jgi:hypothetical protein